MCKSMRSIITHNGQPFLPLPYFILNDEFGHTACNPHVSVTVPIIRTQKNDEFNNFHVLHSTTEHEPQFSSAAYHPTPP